MLATVQTHWLDICEYFTRVQCAGTDSEERELARELPKVEDHLAIILDALLTEKQHIEANQRAAQQHQDDALVSLPRRQASISSFASSLLHSSLQSWGEKAGDPPSGRGSFAETASNTLLSTPRTMMGGQGSPGEGPSNLLFAPFELPPCYHYLFAPQSPSPSLTGTSLDATPIAANTALPHPATPERTAMPTEQKADDAATAAVPNVTSVFPDTISSTFLLALCLYAKHNQPAGSRAVILRFLQDLLLRADLPLLVRHGVRRRTAGSHVDGTAAPPRSLLQLSLSSSIVPLLDMIRRVGGQLDPTHPFGGPKRTAAPAGEGRIVGGGSGGKQCAGSRNGTAQALADSDAERTAFVRFLCALAERIEQVPDLANYFVTTPTSTLPAGPAGEADRSETFVLLDVLLPYMTHDCTAPGWAQRRDTCRYALSAVLSLAKCPDTWVQDLVARKTAIADRTIAAACTTLLTLCKIPDNDDSEVQLLYLRDVLRFWSAMCLSAPAVADGLGLAELIEGDFARMALASLFTSPDSRVYSAACLVTSALLSDLNSSGPVVPAAIARALLSPVVDVDTGRRSRHRAAADFYEMVMRRGGGADSGSTANTESRLGSFFDFYIISRLSTRPTLTEEDMASKAVLNVMVTEWTAVEATLALLKALAENCPCLFAKYALLANMSDLSTLRSASASASSPAMGSACEALSAANSAPTIDVNALFPARLRTVEGGRREEVCGVSSEQLSEEVLEAMLRIETNAPSGALHERQQVVCGSTAVEDARPVEQGNVWFHPPAADQAPLTRVLCDLLAHFTTIPFRAAILLTQLCVRVCLLPDLRVLYTLLDPDRGPMTEALQQIRHHIDREMDEDEEFAVASAAAAAAAAASSPTPVATAAMAAGSPSRSPSVSLAGMMKAEGKRGRSTSAARSLEEATTTAAAPSSPASVPPAAFTRAYLYEVYLSYWAFLPAHVLGSLADERDTRALELITTPTTVSPVVGAPGTLSDDALKALIRHQSFLESCASLEQFRMELDAAVGYMTLSHNLMALRV